MRELEPLTEFVSFSRPTWYILTATNASHCLVHFLNMQEYEEYLHNKVRTFGDVRLLKIDPEL